MLSSGGSRSATFSLTNFLAHGRLLATVCLKPESLVCKVTGCDTGRPDTAQRHVQEHLWTGHKATDLHMPACPKRADAIAAHQQQLQQEASESKWATTSHSAAETASQGATGGACKRQGCR